MLKTNKAHQKAQNRAFAKIRLNDARALASTDQYFKSRCYWLAHGEGFRGEVCVDAALKYMEFLGVDPDKREGRLSCLENISLMAQPNYEDRIDEAAIAYSYIYGP
jgi:hypothetical protein